MTKKGDRLLLLSVAGQMSRPVWKADDDRLAAKLLVKG